MSALRATYTSTLTVSSTTGSLMQFTGPTNQKTWVQFEVFCKDTTGGSMVDIQVRRTGTDDGTKVALTAVKNNPQDTETVQGTMNRFTASATDDGSVVYRATIRSDRSVPFPSILVNGGEKVSLFATTTAAVALQFNARIEQ